jgi:membrane protein implicated in regulation of membrane protease activity
MMDSQRDELTRTTRQEEPAMSAPTKFEPIAPGEMLQIAGLIILVVSLTATGDLRYALAAVLLSQVGLTMGYRRCRRRLEEYEQTFRKMDDVLERILR